jgi:WD40 repeat protein
VKAKGNEKEFDICVIGGYNFLTYSPDGAYFACSQQGYVAYRNGMGNINPNWGHQPSALVDIRRASDPDNELIRFSDLSEMGIADTFRSQSVSSVSFSNDNKKLLMVGKDGVVIVRNLHLEDYASK